MREIRARASQKARFSMREFLLSIREREREENSLFRFIFSRARAKTREREREREKERKKQKNHGERRKSVPFRDGLMSSTVSSFLFLFEDIVCLFCSFVCLFACVLEKQLLKSADTHTEERKKKKVRRGSFRLKNFNYFA